MGVNARCLSNVYRDGDDWDLEPVYVWTGEVSRFNVGELTDHGIVRTVLDQTRTWGDCSTDGEKTLSLYTILTLYLVARRTCSIDHSAKVSGNQRGAVLYWRCAPLRPLVCSDGNFGEAPNVPILMEEHIH